MTGQEARDDEREALIAEATRQMSDLDVITNPPFTRAFIRRLGLALQAAHRELGEARKQPEPKWEFGEMSAMGGVWPIKPDISPELWASTPVERRRRRIAPGPWVPVGEGEQRGDVSR